MSTGPPLHVGVVGAGTLGATVVRAALAAGSPVTVVVRGGAERCRERAEELRSAVHRDARRGRPAAGDPEAVLRGLRCTSRMAELADADVVVESVPEDPVLKRRVIAAVEEAVTDRAVIASTTSSIPASALARGARHPERVVVAHYVWPAHRVPLVEVSYHRRTDPAAAGTLGLLLAAQGKRTVQVADRPGFLITRALFAYWDAVLQLVREGCSPAAVDDALTGFGWPMGPVAVMEAAGLRSVARIHDDLAPHLGSRFPSLGALAAAVARGAEQVRGPGGGLDPRTAALLRPAGRSAGHPAGAIVERAVGALAREVDRAVTEGVVASWDEAGWAVDTAYGFPSDRGGLAQWWQQVPRTDARVTGPVPRPAPVESTAVGGQHIERTLA